jgi:hypothetical protein
MKEKILLGMNEREGGLAGAMALPKFAKKKN